MTRPKSRSRITGKGADGSFMAIPHAVLNSPNWLKLSPYATKLFVDLWAQYKGTNNGDLCATWSMMKVRGWRSKATLHKALAELEYYGLIIKSRQGGRKLASLYAATFKSIDDCKGKLDIKSGPPLSTWRLDVVTPFEVPSRGKGWGARSVESLPHEVGYHDTSGGLVDHRPTVH